MVEEEEKYTKHLRRYASSWDHGLKLLKEKEARKAEQKEEDLRRRHGYMLVPAARTWLRVKKNVKVGCNLMTDVKIPEVVPRSRRVSFCMLNNVSGGVPENIEELRYNKQIKEKFGSHNNYMQLRRTQLKKLDVKEKK